MGRQVEVRETKERIEIFEGPRKLASHERVLDPSDARVTEPTHRPPRHEGVFARRTSVEEQRLAARMPEMQPYLGLLKKRGRGTTRDLRWLLRMLDDYPGGAVRAALEEATRYGMTDLERFERMVLRRIVQNFFAPPRRDRRQDPPDETEDA